MLETSYSGLDPKVQKILSTFFDSRDIQKAFRFIEDDKIDISFFKGDPSSYFIVSGLIKDTSMVEGRISFKSKEGHKQIQGQCTCSKWAESGRCPHMASLFIKFHLKKSSAHPQRDFQSSMFENTVWVEEYGTIITDPKSFHGAGRSKGHSTYFAHQYLLTDRRRVSFPLPLPFSGKIGIEVSSTKAFPKFFFITKEGARITHISLFETLYLFDWVHGISYSLPNDFMAFIKRIYLLGNDVCANDYLRSSKELRARDLVEFVVGDRDLRQVPRLKVTPVVSISESSHAHFFDVSISFAGSSPSPAKRTHIMFDELRAFSFDGGLLTSFKKNSKAYELIKITASLIDKTLRQNLPLNFEKIWQSSHSKNRWRVLMEAFFSDGDIEDYSKKEARLYYCEALTLRRLFQELVLSFGAQSFHDSRYLQTENKLVLKVRKSKLLENISYFFKELSSLGGEIYYNESKVNLWKSKATWRRQLSKIDWFEINVEISKEDMDIIEKIDLETGQFFDSDKMILLDEDQKTLLQFLKRYTKTTSIKRSFSEPKDGMRSFSFPIQRTQIFELFELRKSGLDDILTEEEIELCEKLINLKEIPSYPIPKKPADHLRPYQIDGYRWLYFLWENRFGACLADDMGLGKTIQTISFLQATIESIHKVLIICPVSILSNWEDEFEKFSTLSGEICLYYGGSREMDFEKKIILTSYGVMKREAETTFKDLEFDVMILDEVQNLKNAKSMGAENVRKIKAGFHLCLTGTPVENDLNEFYNILDLALPGVWGPTPHLQSSQFDQPLMLAKKMARPFILRRTKSQVLKDLPQKIENTVFLRFSDEEKRNYLSQLGLVRKRLEQMPSNRRYGEVFKGLLELRQLCLWQNRDELYSTKIKFLLKDLEQILLEKHQVLVFSQFTTYLDIIENQLIQKDIRYSRIDGSYSVKKRTENIRLFQSGETEVFLISLKAGGLGLNLTAANYVYLMDPWWNPAVEAQAIGRAHRIGQKRSINVYRLIIKNSVEEKVLELQKAKKKLFDDLLGDENGEYFTGKLSMKDFEALLSP
ncbi:MAG: DEAD/DEAH box helicase [Bacteriovoracales bacterium]|nr:DEAD/DEAH box helicase [Bacteriovoracales bacterium]